nr:gliding motility protein RemB [Luteirhabdus pelagi]
MKVIVPFLLFLFTLSMVAQTVTTELEKYPVFPACEAVPAATLPTCFDAEVQQFISTNFELPEVVVNEEYKGTLSVLFEVNKEGSFQVIYVDAIYDELKTEVRNVFDKLPTIQPPTYNGEPSYMQFTITLPIPLSTNSFRISENGNELAEDTDERIQQLKNEYDAIEKLPYENEEYQSHINIPLSHHQYSLFDPSLNRIGQNNHTSMKPFTYQNVDKYYDFEGNYEALVKDKETWLGRKWWNEHMVAYKGKDFWFTLDPGVDLQAGKDFDADINTYNNTRLVYTQGGLGKNFNFFAVVYESQGRFADYFNRYAESHRPDGGNPAIIPGRGIAKTFKKDSYDYPLATGHISYSPSEWFNFQLGHGKLFIGDGYRSLLLSDNASPYPFFKINTNFWKIQYTNIWMSLRDVRSAVTEDGSFRTKYMAKHYLSYNVTKRLNLGFFESVIWENDNDRGFDFNYINPIIFYRAIEFSTGSRGGNALIGLSAKYKFTDRFNMYAQLMIDEFSSGDILGGEGSYKNKQAYQLGAKYYDAFGLKNLCLQAEYNRVRPYTYSHNSITLNYGHNNQSMAHTLGANFSEFIAIARYQKDRWFGDAKVIFATRGLDFDTAEDSFFYGGDVYGTEDNRPSDLGNNLGQGNATDFFHTELQGGYLINPATNLKVYASIIFRSFTPEVDTDTTFENNTTWLNLGIRTDLFNWYYDF